VELVVELSLPPPQAESAATVKHDNAAIAAVE
jgi:hypothetical protein